MKTSFLRELTLYRFRYIIGYGVFGALLVLILAVDLTSVPRGLSDAEMASAVASNRISLLSPQTADVVNLPYHLAQKASISLLGLTPLAIKLPSVIIALTTGIALAFMLSRWFSRNVAVLASLLACTSAPFISMGRTGVPVVIVTLWTVLLLLAATQLTTKTHGTFPWKLVALISGILLLYTPLGVYPVIALAISGLLHPHVRHQIKRTKPWQVAVFGVLSLLLLAPLAVAVALHPAVMLAITGVNNFVTSFEELQSSIVSLFTTFFSFSQSHVGLSIAPYFSIIVAMLVALGFLRVVKDHYAARSYMLLIWTAFVTVVVVLSPAQTHLVFTPAVLFMAIGVETLIREWYGLFPRNPYARIGALVPLAIITIGAVGVETSRYFDGYLYTANIKGYHAELAAVREVFGDDARSMKRIVAPADQVSFYDILRREYPHLTVATSTTDNPNVRQAVIAGAPEQLNKPPTTIITGPLQEEGVLVRVYGPKPLQL